MRVTLSRLTTHPGDGVYAITCRLLSFGANGPRCLKRFCPIFPTGLEKAPGLWSIVPLLSQYIAIRCGGPGGSRTHVQIAVSSVLSAVACAFAYTHARSTCRNLAGPFFLRTLFFSTPGPHMRPSRHQQLNGFPTRPMLRYSEPLLLRVHTLLAVRPACAGVACGIDMISAHNRGYFF